MGIGGGVAAMNASSASSADVAAVVKEIALRHDPANVCNPSVLAGNPTLQKIYGTGNPSNPCGTVAGDTSSYNTGVAVMATGWVFFGVGVVGTAAYALVDWFPHRASASSSGSAAPRSSRPDVAVVPLVSPTLHGLGVLGTF